MSVDHAVGSAPVLASVLERWSVDRYGTWALVEVIQAIAGAAARLAPIVAITPLKSALDGRSSAPSTSASTDTLERHAEIHFVDALAQLDVAAVSTTHTDEPTPLAADAGLVVTLDPANGAAGVHANAPVGTVFGVLPAIGSTTDLTAALLQPGRRQLAAGVIVYGPCTTLALTVGDGTDIYILDPRSREFRLVRRRTRIQCIAPDAEGTASERGQRPAPLIDRDPTSTSTGADPHGKAHGRAASRAPDSVAAEAYRVLTCGGSCLRAADPRSGDRRGLVRLVHGANPIAMLCDQAGGTATNGPHHILDLAPTSLTQRVPLLFGARCDVARAREYVPPSASAADGSSSST